MTNHPLTISAHPRLYHHRTPLVSSGAPVNVVASSTTPTNISRLLRGSSATSMNATGTKISSIGFSTLNPATISARLTTYGQFAYGRMGVGAEGRLRRSSSSVTLSPLLPYAPSLLAVTLHKGQQRQETRALHGRRDLPLVTRTHSRHAARQNLALIGDEARKRLLVLVVDEANAVLAERTVLRLSTDCH